jgi:hypothetical protein
MLSYLTGDVKSDIDFPIVEQHTVDCLDGVLSGFGSLVMNKTVSFGGTMFIGGNFARQNVPERSEGIMKGLCK